MAQAGHGGHLQERAVRFWKHQSPHQARRRCRRAVKRGEPLGMLWRLALFYLVVAPLELYACRPFGGTPNIDPPTGIETITGLALAFLLGPIFNVTISVILIKRAGRLSGFTAGFM